MKFINTEKSDKNIPTGYLKASLIVMVIAFHSALAYIPELPAPAASFLAEPRIWRAIPIIDTGRWGGFTPYAVFFNSFAMVLMFFLSGLFVWKSLLSKGNRKFIYDRFVRLGYPFVILILFAAPLAYYPSYLATKDNTGLYNFCRQWLSMPD